MSDLFLREGYHAQGSIAKLLEALGEYRSSLVQDKLARLLLCEQVLSVFLHGSFSRGTADASSDLDIIVVVEDHFLDELAAKLRHDFATDPRVAAFATIDRFPWFGHLETAIYERPVWFSLEVGFVSNLKLDHFYVEPDAWVIKDRDGQVASRRDRCLIQRRMENNQYRESLGYELLNLIMKFAKAIERGHLWNAYNYCSVARRILFDLDRVSGHGTDAVFVGLIERRIESELPAEVIIRYTDTTPRYDAADLKRVFLQQLDAVLARPEALSWPVNVTIAIREWKDKLGLG